MNQDTFLTDPNVCEFIWWAGHLTSGERRLRKDTDAGVFASHETVSLYDAYKKYEWQEAGFDETCELLDKCAGTLRLLMDRLPASNVEKEKFLRVATLVVRWGGINKLDRLERLRNNALEVLTDCARQLEPATATVEGLRGFKYMGSGFSKIYSLMIDDFPIYDSRVACALTSLICLFCHDTGLPRVPEILKLGVPLGRGSKTRNPSRGDYEFPDIRGSQYSLHARSNLKAAWILKQLAVNSDAGPFSKVPEHRKVRAFEASLFMIGEEQLDDNSVMSP